MNNETTKNRLLDATASIIEVAGVAAATSRAITNTAGENLGSINYHFGSKEALINEAIGQSARTLIAPVIKALESDKDPVGKLSEVTILLNSLITQNPNLARGYVNGLVSQQGRESETLTLLEALTNVLAEELAAQSARGELPSWVEPRAMAELMVALANGVAVGSTMSAEMVNPSAVASQFAQLLIAAKPSVESC